MNNTANYELTIVVPVYNEEDNLDRVEREMAAFLPDAAVKACVLLVNDGSTDSSLQKIKDMCRRNADFFYISSADNHGRMLRDFTYIDDIATGIGLVLGSHWADAVPSRIYNIGCQHPVSLLDFIHTIEQAVGRKAIMKMMGMQPGDVVRTYADTSRLERDLGYRPTTTLAEGIARLYDWYRAYTLKKSHTETAIITPATMR